MRGTKAWTSRRARPAKLLNCQEPPPCPPCLRRARHAREAAEKFARAEMQIFSGGM